MRNNTISFSERIYRVKIESMYVRSKVVISFMSYYIIPFWTWLNIVRSLFVTILSRREKKFEATEMKE